jgi:hypothetical protein
VLLGIGGVSTSKRIPGDPAPYSLARTETVSPPSSTHRQREYCQKADCSIGSGKDGILDLMGCAFRRGSGGEAVSASGGPSVLLAKQPKHMQHELQPSKAWAKKMNAEGLGQLLAAP